MKDSGDKGDSDSVSIWSEYDSYFISNHFVITRVPVSLNRYTSSDKVISMYILFYM